MKLQFAISQKLDQRKLQNDPPSLKNKTRHPEPTPSTRLRLRVTATAETILRGGHPWLFAESIREQNRPGELGELAVIYDRKDKFLAIGLFDPDSPIRVRALHAGKPVTVDAAWWRARLEKTLQRREGLFDLDTNGYRCINGESDGWPGLVMDRYADTLALKIYTAAWLPRLDEIIGWVNQLVANDRIVLRLSRNIQTLAAARFKLADGQLLRGKSPDGPVVFSENGLRFFADVLRGQKTGFFLDQRENRKMIGSLAAGTEMLNAFSFSGGFSLYAAHGGAGSVTDLDLSSHALESARQNFRLNAEVKAVKACRHETIQADAFKWLAETDRGFDLVVLDPPSLAKRETERAGAIHAYGQLIANGIRLTKPGGTLMAASCSAHVSVAEFFEAARAVAKTSGRAFAELRTTGHAPDHLATFKEAEYLKAIYFRFKN